MLAELHTAELTGRSLDAYAPVAGRDALDEIRSLAEPLRGRRVLYVSAAAIAGGVDEMLRSLVPLLRDAGVEAARASVFGDAELRELQATVGDAIQGGEWAVSDQAWQAYLGGCAQLGEEIATAGWDTVVIADSQPAPMIAAPGDATDWIWRCHVDASEPDDEAWDRLAPFIARFDARVFSLAAFVPPGLPPEGMHLVAPAIDPLSPKNADVPWEVTGAALRSLGVDLSRPLVCQVARFDGWADPLATIEAWRLARAELPDLQLALVGSVSEHADSWRTLREIAEFDRPGEGLHCLTDREGIGAIEVNAFRRISRCTLQRSLREGFGLGISESLYRRTPVVAGESDGPRAQLRDGRDGFIAAEPEECARRIVELVRDPGLALAMGRSGRERVIERFCLPRLVADELRVLAAPRGAASPSEVA